MKGGIRVVAFQPTDIFAMMVVHSQQQMLVTLTATVLLIGPQEVEVRIHEVCQKELTGAETTSHDILCDKVSSCMV